MQITHPCHTVCQLAPLWVCTLSDRLHLAGTACQCQHLAVLAGVTYVLLALHATGNRIDCTLSWVTPWVASLSTQLMSCYIVLMLLTPSIAAGSVCVNGTTYVASTAAGCTSLVSAYNSTDYLGYCLPSDTASSTWTALHATVNKPAVICERVQLCSCWSNYLFILAHSPSVSMLILASTYHACYTSKHKQNLSGLCYCSSQVLSCVFCA